MFSIMIWLISFGILASIINQWMKKKPLGQYYEIFDYQGVDPNSSAPVETFSQRSPNEHVLSGQQQAIQPSDSLSPPHAPISSGAFNIEYLPSQPGRQMLQWHLYPKESEIWNAEKILQSTQIFESKKTVMGQLSLNLQRVSDSLFPQEQVMIANNIKTGTFIFDADTSSSEQVKGIILFGAYQTDDEKKMLRSHFEKIVTLLNQHLESLIFDEDFKPIFLREEPKSFG